MNMRRQSLLWYLLIWFGSGYASPYYYRESKHHSEHQREYSYGAHGVTGPSSESLPAEYEIPQVSVPVKPERYSSYVYPSEANGYRQNYNGGYSVTYGTRVGSPKCEPLYSNGRLVQSCFYVHPSQGYLQESRTSGFQIPNEEQRRYIQSHSHYSKQEHIGGQLQSGQEEASLENIGDGQAHRDEFGQRETSEDGFGQEPYQDSLEIGQHQEDVGQQRLESSYHQKVLKNVQKVRNQGQTLILQHERPYQYPAHSNLEIGQREEILTVPGDSGHLELSQSKPQPHSVGQIKERESVHSSQYSSSVIGHKPLQGHLIVSSHKKEESLYQQPGSKNLDLGQKEEPLTIINSDDLGQREESESLHTFNNKELLGGQREESSISFGSDDLGQQPERESLYPSSLEVGHKPLQSHLIVSSHKKEESLYQQHGSENLDLGQKEEPLTIINSDDLGQREESESLHTFNNKELLGGQREESSISFGSDDLGQQPERESLYPSSLAVSHKPLPGHLLVSSHKKEESLYQQHGGENLNIGQREEPLTIINSDDLGQREESESLHTFNNKELLGGQREESSISFGSHDLGQQPERESLYPSSLEVGHRPSQGHLIVSSHKKEESIYQQHGGEHLNIGQKEEPLTIINSDDLGQREESESLHTFNNNKELLGGQREESSISFGSDDLGQQPERESLYPSSLEVGHRPSQGHLIVSSHKKEESIYQHHGSENLDIGQKEVPLTIINSDDLGQREESESLHTSSNKELLGGQREESSISFGSDDLGQKEEKDSTFDGFHLVGQKEIDSDILGQEKEKEIISFNHEQGKNVNMKEVHEHPHRVSWATKLCEHGKHYQHSGFGVGQIGHNALMGNSEGQESIKVVSGNPITKEIHRTYHHNDGDRGTSYFSSMSKSYSSHSGSAETPKFVLPSINKQFGDIENLGQKVEDLSKALESEGISQKSDTISTGNGKTSEVQISRSPAVAIHNAEIQELGLENLNTQGVFQSSVIQKIPPREENILVTRKEEIAYEYPSTQRSYSKKHSRHSISRQESRSIIPSATIDSFGQQMSASQSSHQSSGGWYGFSQYGSSKIQNDRDYLSDEPIKRTRQRRRADRHGDIDSFLSELDKDIARDNKGKQGQGGYVQVTSQQHTPSNSGTFSYSETGHKSQSSSGSSSSGSSGSWFKKIGANISSTYNRAKDKIGETFSQAKDKAKEMASNVKDTVRYSVS